MKAVVLEKPGELRMRDVEPAADAKPGEACVRVMTVGLCGTDHHAFRGEQPFFQYPRILGHELGVEIVAVGKNARGLKPGDWCALEPYLNCGQCMACRRGKTNCCVNLKVLGVHVDGGMRDRITVPVSKLHRSESVPIDQLALVETLGIGAHAVRRAAPDPGESALIIGAGPIGLSVALFAAQAKARTIVMDISPERLQFCRDVVQVEHLLDGSTDPLARLQDLLSGDLPTLVFDCTGSSKSMHNAFHYVAHGGKLVFVGLVQGDVTFHDPHVHTREMTILSSRNSTAEEFRRIISLMESGDINVQRWITHRTSSATFIETYPHWIGFGDGMVKGLIEWVGA